MAVLLLATVFLGFEKTYYLAGMFKAPLPSWVIHVHAVAFTSWIVLLIVQSLLVSAGRVDMHRRPGMVGFGLACVMVVLGVMAGTDLLRRGGAALGANAKAFYAATLGDMLIFGVLVFLAYRARSKPAVHKRLIVIATITLMQAAINRWPFAVLEREPFLIDIIPSLFVLLLVAYDLWSIRRVHRATLWGGLSSLSCRNWKCRSVEQPAWQSFATWVLERATSIHGG